MADLTITEVELVEVIQQMTLPAAAALTKGDAVRIDTNGKWADADASAAGTADVWGVVLESVIAGETVTAVKKGVLDVGNALSGIAYGGYVYLSDTAGELADAAGTVSKKVGRVVPVFGYTTADKLLEITISDG